MTLSRWTSGRIIVRGDEDARRNVRGLTIEPIRIVPPERRSTRGFARHAVHYAGTTVYFLDDASFPEPEAFWVGGARRREIVVQPDAPRPAITLLVRNGAVENTVLMRTGVAGRAAARSRRGAPACRCRSITTRAPRP